jgi:hypothetical protein
MMTLLDSLHSLLSFITENCAVNDPRHYNNIPPALREHLDAACIQLGEWLDEVNGD